jgi:hypothetical protein
MSGTTSSHRTTRAPLGIGATVAITGAGLTGPAAALTLARAGYEVTVTEQRPAGELHSAGILGITWANWAALETAGVDLSAGLPGNVYRDYVLGKSHRSPFRLIVWTDLHNAMVEAARRAGVIFRFGTVAHPGQGDADYDIDAGGIVSAARRHLPSTYLGSFIYRGISPLNTAENFTTVKLPNKQGFLDIGHTANGAGWAFGVRRPAPDHFRTTFTDTPPPEVDGLPDQFRTIVRATQTIMVLPQSGWTVAPTLHDSAWRQFTLGDANGPVRPITTSGANLAIQAGLHSPDLLAGSDDVGTSLLRRRAWALDLGLRLRGPEIGGTLEDPDFRRNQRALYGTFTSDAR